MNKLKQHLEKVDRCVHSPEAGVFTNMVDDVHKQLELKTSASREFIRIALANAILMDEKQLDYGPDNINAHGTYGVVVRLGDKVRRLDHLFKKGRKRRSINESILDTFRDASNYGIIAIQLEEGRWPSE